MKRLPVLPRLSRPRLSHPRLSVPRLSPPRLSPLRVLVLAVVLAVVGGFVAGQVAAAQPTTWQSNRQVLIRIWSVDSLVLSGQAIDIGVTDLADAATVVTSADVLGPAADTLDAEGLDSEDLMDDVTATPSQSSDFVQITVTGGTPDEAAERARVVGNKFELVVRQKVLASVQQILAQSAADPADPGDIELRAAGISAVDPVQIYESGEPERSGLSDRTYIAAGVVGGVGLAALIAVLLAFGAPRLRRPGDVANALGLPALAWRSDGSHAADGGLAAELVLASTRGCVTVSPARPQDAAMAARFASWLATDQQADATRVVSLDSPVEGMAASRPEAGSVTASVLVTTAGSPADTIVRASSLLDRWRPVDAVVLVG